jgi:O-antigen/teichoic acid export membrane protein
VEPAADGGSPTSTAGLVGRIVRAAGAQGLNQLARIVQLFLLVPICLSAWGTAVYEDWLLLNSIAAFFLLLGDLGFGQLTTVTLIDAWSKKEQERFSIEWRRAMGLFALLVLALTSALLALWLMRGWTALMPTRSMSRAEIATTAVLLCLGQVSGILIGVGLGAYRARGDLSRSYHVSSILVLLQTAAVAGSAALGAKPIAAALGNFVVMAATLAAIVIDFRRRYPDMRWKPIFPASGEFCARVLDAVGYLAHPTALTVMLNGPNLILANLGAPQGAIALFTASRTIAGVARQLPYQFAHPTGVELASLLARGEHQGLAGVYANACRVLAIVVGVLSGFTVVAAPLVMTLWTRGKIVYDTELMFLLVGTTAICAPSQVAYMLLWYGGYPKILNRALVCSTGLAMVLAVLFEPLLGVRGVAAGLGAGEILGIAGYLSLLVDRMLERKAGDGLLRNFAISVVSFLGSAAVGYLLYHLIDPRGWFGLMEFSVAWSILAAIGLHSTLLSASQRARLVAVALDFIRSWKPKKATS